MRACIRFRVDLPHFKTQTENIIALLDKGLISPVDAMFKIYPELSTEEQAIQKLRIIRQQKIEFL